MTVAVEVLGVRIDIRLPADAGHEIRDQITSAWQHCLTNSADPAPHQVAWRGPDAMTGMHLLSQDVTRAAIDARAGEAVMLHAAAIADADSGATLAVVGASGAGKTTWVQAHGRNRRYLSDETVLITQDLRIIGVPKPLSLGHRGLKRQHPPEEFGLIEADGTEHLAGLWLLDRDGTTPARLAEVEMLDTLPLLSEQASYLTAVDRPLQQMASIVSACGGLRRAHYGEATDLADIVAEALA
ncbi:MAG TPA: hypothetical protein VJL80_11390 [Aeromicrobium sp.]|nr:hypothetical protein [Aeromicrobium sp.]HKY58630.1 hypothetical protein [Aeromicrobium sp.]